MVDDAQIFLLLASREADLLKPLLAEAFQHPGGDMQRLRTAICSFVRRTKEQKAMPETTMLALKSMITVAAGAQHYRTRLQTALSERILLWCITEYFNKSYPEPVLPENGVDGVEMHERLERIDNAPRPRSAADRPIRLELVDDRATRLERMDAPPSLVEMLGNTPTRTRLILLHNRPSTPHS